MIPLVTIVVAENRDTTHRKRIEGGKYLVKRIGFRATERIHSWIADCTNLMLADLFGK